MDEPKQHSNQAASVKRNKNPVWKQLYESGFFGLLVGAVVLITLVIVLGAGIKDDGDRVTVWIVGILTIITVFLAIVNTVTSREMVDIMDRQESEMTQQRELMKDQLKEMRDQLSHSKEVFRASQQAVIVITAAGLREPIRSGNFPVATFNTKNTGNGTAYNVHGFAEFRFLAESQFQDFYQHQSVHQNIADREWDSGGEVMGVGQDLPNSTHPRRWPDGVLESLESGRVGAFVFGIVAYTDGLGRVWGLKFSSRVVDLNDTKLIRFQNEMVEVKPEQPDPDAEK